jgi:nitrogen regulatory protein P-II 1
MKKIEAIIRPEKLTIVKFMLGEAGFYGLNATQVSGRGGQRGIVHTGRAGQTITVDMLPKVKLELVVKNSDVDTVVDIIVESARTGEIGDGKIFIHPIEDTIRVRTGERGDAAV